MGAGISTTSNTASAIAQAYTSVSNNTNVFDDENVIQDQTTTLENCDITSAKSNTFDMETRMTQSMQQTSNLRDISTISNDVAQALSQAATSNVGLGVIGISGATNQAATYANMTSNVSNYIQVSAKQSISSGQEFTCQNSTIVSTNGGFNLSMLETGDMKNTQGTTVQNGSQINNTMDQTIAQTASASTGGKWWVILAIVVLLIIGIVVFKLKDAKSKAGQAIDMKQAIELGCCTKAQLNVDNIQAGAGGNACDGCDCYALMHPHMKVSAATLWVYFIGILVIGIIIAVWYALVGGRGCLFSGACGVNQGTKFSGCSCNFDAVTVEGQTCEDAVASSFLSNGFPTKYQYRLFIHNNNESKSCNTDAIVAQTSLQGMIVSALKSKTSNKNSNNGKNMDTLRTYMCYYGWPDELTGIYGNACDTGINIRAIQNMFQAGAKFLSKQNATDYPTLFPIIKAYESTTSEGLSKMGGALYAFLCPLRPAVFSDNLGSPASTNSPGFDVFPKGYPKPKSQTFESCVNAGWIYNSTPKNNYFVQVPPAFRYGTGASGQASCEPNCKVNTNAGCCSVHSMKYTCSSQGGMPYSCTCGQSTVTDKDADETIGDFCGGGGNNVRFTPTGEVLMQIPPVTDTSGHTGACKTKAEPKCKPSGDAYQTLAGANNILPFYAEWTFFKLDSSVGSNDGCVGNTNETNETETGSQCSTCMTENEMSLIRLLWGGFLAYVSNHPIDEVWGLNAFLDTTNSASELQPDHFYLHNMPNMPEGFIGSSLDASADPDDPTSSDISKDKSLLVLTPINLTAYSVENGLHQAGCAEGHPVLAGQSYNASAQQLGYCRNGFFNRVTLYTIIGFLAFWILMLPIYLFLRWYVNRGTSSRYLEKAEETRLSKRSSSDSAATDQGESQGIEMAAVSKQAKIANQNRQLNKEDRARVQQSQQTQASQPSQPSQQTKPSQPQPNANDPLADISGATVVG